MTVGKKTMVGVGALLLGGQLSTEIINLRAGGSRDTQ
jgi:hypothetical protein